MGLGGLDSWKTNYDSSAEARAANDTEARQLTAEEAEEHRVEEAISAFRRACAALEAYRDAVGVSVGACAVLECALFNLIEDGEYGVDGKLVMRSAVRAVTR